ncbi:ABC-2 family transporter protein [Dactylosporangium aurantiacum]|uniref:ABC-2 family transporter protein n=1 Tax=Dactylosporangium aurantiacum TaxID=35754 RepID=A0A9Q9MN37_9ACTN|nr:ABC-2 family transporter protein [Dactylosporangium aurantiacum]MDG6103966.1 ABC-2 family transporter protein [Dactylosporangium aurantiacum]UWZ58856.1 ABC-2 family transporter protein [Dactylosporangium aurantiacum]
MTGWTRHLRVLGICWRAAVAGEAEYRLNFVSNIMLSVFWMLWAAAGASVYFRHTGAVAGWTNAEVLVVIGLFFTLNGLRQMLLQPNLERMTDYVRLGTLDFLLLKPFDAQLLVSLRHLNVATLLDPALGLALTTTGVILTGRGTSVAALASFAWMLACAMLLMYALTVLMMAAAVRLVAAEELGRVTYAFNELSRFPVDLYRNPAQTILTIVPIAFLTTYPAAALLGRLNPYLLPLAPVVAALALALATLAWRRALRSYTGAGS